MINTLLIIIIILVGAFCLVSVGYSLNLNASMATLHSVMKLNADLIDAHRTLLADYNNLVDTHNELVDKYDEECEYASEVTGEIIYNAWAYTLLLFALKAHKRIQLVVDNTCTKSL